MAKPDLLLIFLVSYSNVTQVVHGQDVSTLGQQRDKKLLIILDNLHKAKNYPENYQAPGVIHINTR